MTTLPQTISARSQPPRGVSGLPAVASPVLAPVPYTPPAAGGLTGADVWRVVRQNLWIFALAAIVSGAIGYGINNYLNDHYQQWTADGYVKVQPPLQLDVNGRLVIAQGYTDADLATTMKDQAQRLKSSELLTKLLTDNNSATRKSKWLQDKAQKDGSFNLGRALEALQGAFSVRAGEGTSLLLISMTAGNADDARTILLEIVNTYMEELGRSTTQLRGQNTESLRLLTEARLRERNEIEAEVTKLAASMKGDDSMSEVILGQKVALATSELSDAQKKLTAAEQGLQAAKDAVNKGLDPSGVAQMVDQDPIIRNYRDEITRLEVSKDVVSRQSGPNSNSVMDLQRRIDNMRDAVRQQEDDTRAKARNEITSGWESQLKGAQETADDLKDKEKRLNDQLNEIGVARSQLESARRRLATASDVYENMRLQLSTQQLDSTSRPNEQLSWAARPTTPYTPSFPNLKLTVAMCVLLGVGLAVGLAFLREVLDTSVRSPRDVGRVGQMNVLGTIPDKASDPEAGDPLALSIANAPHSITAEEYRKVRSRLGHVTPLETTRTILVTSPQPGDGKTTVACNLAAGMALNGRKILLVDANFRKPAIHKVFGLSCDVGLADVLADAGRFDELIHETSVPNLHVLPAGHKPANPTELLEGTPFTDFVDAALDEFDHVIFDSGPLLFVSETGALAPQCDGVVSVVRARKSSRGLLGRMRDSLRSLNVEHLGVVLNAVRGQAGGYYSRNIKTFYAYQKAGQ